MVRRWMIAVIFGSCLGSLSGCGDRHTQVSSAQPEAVSDAAQLQSSAQSSAQSTAVDPEKDEPDYTDVEDSVSSNPTSFRSMELPVTCEIDHSTIAHSTDDFPALPTTLIPQVPPIHPFEPVEYWVDAYDLWGVGYLETQDYTPGYEWIASLVLPLHDSPEGDFVGWLACGSLVDGQTQAIQTFTMPNLIQTGSAGTV